MDPSRSKTPSAHDTAVQLGAWWDHTEWQLMSTPRRPHKVNPLPKSSSLLALRPCNDRVYTAEHKECMPKCTLRQHRQCIMCKTPCLALSATDFLLSSCSVTCSPVRQQQPNAKACASRSPQSSQPYLLLSLLRHTIHHPSSTAQGAADCRPMASELTSVLSLTV